MQRIGSHIIKSAKYGYFSNKESVIKGAHLWKDTVGMAHLITLVSDKKVDRIDDAIYVGEIDRWIHFIRPSNSRE